MAAQTLLPVDKDELANWQLNYCRIWQAESLAPRINVEFSSRMKRSLGRAYPVRKLVRLRHDLQIQPREVLQQVLCHELAHIVAFHRFGARIRPHGRQWQSLMRAAGFTPSVTLDVPHIGSERFPVRRWRHHCPECQVSSTAYRKMTRWRCGNCLQQGRAGHLRIEVLQ